MAVFRLFCTPEGFPGGLDNKESAYNAGDLGSIPGLGRSPGGGDGYPLPYPCLENLDTRVVWLESPNFLPKG